MPSVRITKGVVMVVQVEIGEGGVALLEQHRVGDRNTVGAVGRGPWRTVHGIALGPSGRAWPKLICVRFADLGAVYPRKTSWTPLGPW